ncbi:MAG: hypothetical protein ACM308_01095 [Qipengyuania vulgaris]
MKILPTLIMAVALTAPAVAQDTMTEAELDRFLKPEAPIGTRFKQEPETASVSDARQMQKRLAKCVYYGNKTELNELLANSDFSRIDFSALEFSSEEFFDEIDFGRCLGRAMKGSQYKVYATMRYDTLRNLVAEEAYLYTNKQAPVREPDAPTVIDARFAKGRAGPQTEVLAEVSDCISYRNPQGAHDLLDSTPGSSGEGDALEALYSTLLTCLDTEEAPNLDTSMVRMMVADGMWTRSHYGAFAAAPSSTAEAE